MHSGGLSWALRDGITWIRLRLVNPRSILVTAAFSVSFPMWEYRRTVESSICPAKSLAVASDTFGFVSREVIAVCLPQ